MNLELHKFDELDSLIRGIHYIKDVYPQEIYYYCNGTSGEHQPNIEQCTYDYSIPYPYILVNIGSGVSILSVQGPKEFKRVWGTSIGGGTFLGLCCLLTGCKTFEEAIELASKGDSSKVDKSVGDIYGGDYDKFNLSSNIIASR